MLPEGTLLSGGEKDRKIIAWDSLQNYNKITETKVRDSWDTLNRTCLFIRRDVCFNSCQKFMVA